MTYLNLFLFFVTIPIAFAQEETKPINYGTIYATHEEVKTAYMNSALDLNKNPYVLTTNGEIHVFNREGSLENKIKLQNPEVSNAEFIILKNKDIFMVRTAPEKQDFVVELMDPEGKVKKTHKLKGKSAITPVELINGRLALGVGNFFYLLTPDLKETFKFEGRSPIAKITEMSGTSITFSDKHNLYFMDSTKKVKAILMGGEEDPFKTTISEKQDLVLVYRDSGQVLLVDKTGKGPVGFKAEARFRGFAELSDGTFAGTCENKKIYFLSSKIRLKNTHIHDSKNATAPFYIGKDILVYATSKELVFLNFQGIPLGTQKFERKDFSTTVFNDLGDNQFMAYVLSTGKILFLKH